jgi:queuine tRNA-ribosyltransferase
LNRTPSFNLRGTSGKARLGTLNLAHGKLETPAFMPVGTQATVKTVRNSDLEADGYTMILGNTYHLYLRPGLEVIRKAGGLHSFMNWKGNILTDSGGFQLFSLAALRKVTEEGYNFQSHIDGSKHILTPENVIHAQTVFGSDVMMVLDECLEQPSEEAITQESVELTLRWAERARKIHPGNGQAMFGIVQGGGFPKLREYCADQLVGMNFDGYAIGGVAVGEERPMMELAVNSCINRLPENKPRYLMGVGKPKDLIDFVGMGVDMFDCVVPTRNARGASFFIPDGRLNIRNAKHRDDFGPVQEDCDCYVCRNHTRAYMHHLFKAKEWLAPIYATLHNLRYFARLMEQLREAIENDRYESVSRELLNRMGNFGNS